MDVTVLDIAAALLNPANADTGTLTGIACVAVAASGFAVLWALKRLPRRHRPTVDELADPAYNPSLDDPRGSR
jgi:hypothetical protein